MSSLLNVGRLASTSTWFRWQLVQIGARLNVNPDYLANVMAVESGFNPAATNPHTKATGLIQFMPDTARRLGTSVNELRSMNAEDQLFFVEKFYKPFAGRIRTPGDAYMATFMPAFVGYPGERVLFEKGSIGYTQNAGLDRNKDGYITVADVTQIAEANYSRASQNSRVEVPDEEPPRPKVPEGPGGSSPGSPSLVLPPTIRRGVRGDDVKRWQRIAGAKVDGIFGPVTEALTMAWQSSRGLVADGIVGPKTWTEALHGTEIRS